MSKICVIDVYFEEIEEGMAHIIKDGIQAIET